MKAEKLVLGHIFLYTSAIREIFFQNKMICESE